MLLFGVRTSYPFLCIPLMSLDVVACKAQGILTKGRDWRLWTTPLELDSITRVPGIIKLSFSKQAVQLRHFYLHENSIYLMILWGWVLFGIYVLHIMCIHNGENIQLWLRSEMPNTPKYCHMIKQHYTHHKLQCLVKICMN